MGVGDGMKTMWGLGSVTKNRFWFEVLWWGEKKPESKRFDVCVLCELNWSIGCNVDRREGLWHTVRTEELKLPESYCHSDHRYVHQRLLSTVSWFFESGHPFLARCKISHILWAHQAVSVKVKLRIYPETLPFELQHSLNQLNGWEGKGKCWDSETGGQG